MNIGFYFITYNKEKKQHWKKLMGKISDEGNRIHIIGSVNDFFEESDKIKVHNLDISVSFLSKIFPQKLITI